MAGVLLALGLGLAAPRAVAQSQSVYFNNADLDDDGRLSLVEFQDWMSYAFKRMDANRDGVLAPSEQLVNNAKTITLADHHARLAGQFKRQDKNGDGFLSPREFLAPPA
jgi:Ca2+-binding EF-hand superfamily protein